MEKHTAEITALHFDRRKIMSSLNEKTAKLTDQLEFQQTRITELEGSLRSQVELSEARTKDHQKIVERYVCLGVDSFSNCC